MRANSRGVSDNNYYQAVGFAISRPLILALGRKNHTKNDTNFSKRCKTRIKNFPGSSSYATIRYNFCANSMMLIVLTNKTVGLSYYIFAMDAKWALHRRPHSRKKFSAAFLLARQKWSSPRRLRDIKPWSQTARLRRLF